MQKYQHDNLLLTKEAFKQYIIKQREAEAASYGLTLEQYQQVIFNGGVVQSVPPTGSL